MPVRWVALIVCAGGVAVAQQEPAPSALHLYYEQQNSGQKPIAQRGIIRPSAAPAAASAPFGIRYNLLDVDPSGRRPPAAVDPNFLWKAGQCAAVRLEANRGGYLYVLAQGSSGVWQPLLPSPQAAGEPHFLPPYTPASIPRDHCFEITPPAGKERLFVIVSEKKEDMADLEKAIRQPAGVAKPLHDQVARLRGELKGRDLKIQKVAAAAPPQDKPNSVFVVAADSRPNDRLVVEIEIEHR